MLILARSLLLLKTMKGFGILNLLCSLALVVCFAGCGTDERRILAASSPRFTLEPSIPQWAQEQALIVRINSKIENSVASAQIAMQMRNSIDSEGRDWTPLLGESFSVQMGNQSFNLAKKGSSANAAEQTYEADLKTYSAAEMNGFLNAHSAEMKIINSEDNLGPARTLSPPALKDVSSVNVVGSLTELSNCAGSGSSTSIRWLGSGNETFSITIGDRSEFNNGGSPDNGFWSAPLNLFSSFFSNEQILDANIFQNGQFGELHHSTKLTMVRTVSGDTLKLSSVFTRTMFIYFLVSHTEPIDIRYVGGCN